MPNVTTATAQLVKRINKQIDLRNDMCYASFHMLSLQIFFKILFFFFCAEIRNYPNIHFVDNENFHADNYLVYSVIKSSVISFLFIMMIFKVTKKSDVADDLKFFLRFLNMNIP